MNAEQLFKGKMGAYIQEVQIGKKTSTEIIVGVSPEEAEKQMQNAIETVTTESSIHNPVVLKQLEVQRLTLQLELAKQETERLKLIYTARDCKCQLSLLIFMFYVYVY